MTLGIAIGLTAGISLSKLSKKPERSKLNYTREINDVAQQFIKNRVSRFDSLNYLLFSDSMLAINKASGFAGPTSYAKYIQSVYPLDFAEVLGVVLLNGDSARAFVRDYGKDTSTVIYNFIKQSSGWKFNGYVFSHDDW